MVIYGGKKNMLKFQFLQVLCSNQRGDIRKSEKKGHSKPKS